MTRRGWAVTAAVVVTVLLLLLLGPCGDDDGAPPQPPPDSATTDTVALPPVADVSPAEGAPAKDEPPRMLYRNGRVHRSPGGPLPRYDVFVTGPGVLALMENNRKDGQEIVANGPRPVQLEDGYLPAAWKVGETDENGVFVTRWSSAVEGRVDLLFANEDAEGNHRFRHRIEGAQDVSLMEIRIPESGAIEGRVRTPDGTPVEKALVYCVPLDVRQPGRPGALCRRATPFTGLFLVDWARHARTDKDGRYRIDGLRPAPYRVFARRRDRGGEIRRVEVLSGVSTADRNLVLDIEGAFVRGLVVDDRTGNPIKGCLVAADDPQGTTMSNDDGTYRLGPLAPGDFRGFVVKMGYGLTWFGPYRLVEGRTFVAPTTHLRKKPD